MRVLSLTSALVALTSMALASVDAAWPDNGATRLHGVNYDTQKCRTAQEELDDLTAIAKIAKSVRIYGIRTDRASPACPTSRLLATARKLNITVHLGMWLDGNADKQIDGKLQDLRDVLKYLDSNVVGFHVGSEAIYRGNYSADKAISYLQRVREVLKGKNIPVTIADVVDSYYQNPQLIDAVDYVSINQFSFWEKVDINYAMVKMLDRIRSIRAQAAAKNKAVMISETGWSSGGYDTKNRVGEPSDANERQFFTNFYHQATAHGLPYYYFVAFEAPWNTEDQFATVEQHFGLLDYYSRQLKPAVANLDLSPRTIVTLQSARGLLAETFNAAQPETVDGVEIIQPSNDKLTQVRYKWFFDATKQQYRSLNSDRCLDAYQPQDGGIVHTYQCVDSERNQRWIYDAKTQQLKHASHTGFCLEDHTASGKLELWTCDAFKDNQRFGLNGAPATGSDLTPGTVSPGQPTTTSPVPTTAAPAPSTCSIEENVDYAGNDIGSAASATAEGCCSICQARSGCKAFTWTNYVGGTCWLKSSNTGKSSKTGARSSVLSSTTTPPPVPTTAAPVPTTTAPVPTTTAPVPTTTAPVPTTTAPVPTTTAPAPSTCSIEENVDYAGNDIGSAASATAEGCCSICQARSGCKAFTWTNYVGGTCWLKSSNTGKSSKSGARSAVVSSTTTPPPQSQCSAVELNVDYSGKDIGNAPSSSVDGCCNICAQRSGCGAYTWSDYNGGTCWLKSEKGTSTPKAGAKSAVYTGATNTCTLVNGIDYYGNDLASAASATPAGCCSICKGRTGCSVFTWTSDNGGTCWLKTTQGTPVPKTGAVSGKV